MGGAVLAILLTLAAGLLFWGRRPFRGLEAADIAAATVLVAPPDVTLELDAGEIETLADRSVSSFRLSINDGMRASFATGKAKGITTIRSINASSLLLVHNM